MRTDSFGTRDDSPLRWHTRDGVKVWTTPKLRRPNLTLHEKDGPLQVVLLADYEALVRSIDETVKLIRSGIPSDAPAVL